MEILLVISRLLDYPEEWLHEGEVELCDAIWRSPLSRETKERMQSFVWKQLDRDILDIQSEYDGLFERGRSLGLWLFEHVHGESRDRGQAMVDLMNQYREAGLEIRSTSCRITFRCFSSLFPPKVKPTLSVGYRK